MSPWLIALILAALPPGASLTPLALDECRLHSDDEELPRAYAEVLDAVDQLAASETLADAFVTTLKSTASHAPGAEGVLEDLFPGTAHIFGAAVWDGDTESLRKNIVSLVGFVSDQASTPTLRGLYLDAVRAAVAVVALAGKVAVPGVPPDAEELPALILRGVRAGITLVAVVRDLPLPPDLKEANDGIGAAIRNELAAAARVPAVARAARTRGGLLSPAKFVY